MKIVVKCCNVYTRSGRKGKLGKDAKSILCGYGLGYVWEQQTIDDVGLQFYTVVYSKIM